MTDAKALNGLCGECDHVWIVAHLPMEVRKVALLGKRAACPKCACTKVFIKMGDRT